MGAGRRRGSDRRHGNCRRPAMNLLVSVLFLPLAAFFLALFIPRSTPHGSRVWALAASLVTFVTSLGLVVWFDRSASGEQFAVDWPWISSRDSAKEFYAFLLLLEFGLIGVFLAQDLFLFYVFWEVSLVPMYFLIGIWGHDRRIYAALKFFLYTFAGSVLMLAAIIYLYNKTHTFSYPAIIDMLSSGHLKFGATEQMVLFLAFFFAFAI